MSDDHLTWEQQERIIDLAGGYHPSVGRHVKGKEFNVVREKYRKRIAEVEAERDALAAQFTKLDKPKYSGAPMLDAVLLERNPLFDAWVQSLPPTYWTRYDLSAARIGWEAAMTKADLLKSDCAKHEAELMLENNRLKWLPASLTPQGAAALIPNWEVATNAQWDEWWEDSKETLGDAKWAY